MSAASACSTATRATRSAWHHWPSHWPPTPADSPTRAATRSQNWRGVAAARARPDAADRGHRRRIHEPDVRRRMPREPLVHRLAGRQSAEAHTSSGRSALAVSGSRSSTSAPWIRTPSSAVPARRPDAGSAITGQPSNLAMRRSDSASVGSGWSGPKTSTPRDVARNSAASARTGRLLRAPAPRVRASLRGRQPSARRSLPAPAVHETAGSGAPAGRRTVASDTARRASARA